MITPTEDPSVNWLPEGEFKFRITQPKFLYESHEVKKGEKPVSLPPVYCSHAVYYNVYQAQVAAKHIIRNSFEFEKRKTGKEFTEGEVKAKCAEIQEVTLP